MNKVVDNCRPLKLIKEMHAVTNNSDKIKTRKCQHLKPFKMSFLMTRESLRVFAISLLPLLSFHSLSLSLFLCFQRKGCDVKKDFSSAIPFNLRFNFLLWEQLHYFI